MTTTGPKSIRNLNITSKFIFGFSRCNYLKLWCHYLQNLDSCWQTDINNSIFFLPVKEYDTLKTCWWKFFKFSWIVHYWKIRKRHVYRRSPCYFRSSRGQKIKNILKIEQKRCFWLHSWFYFYGVFAQKLTYTINIWSKFVFG